VIVSGRAVPSSPLRPDLIDLPLEGERDSLLVAGGRVWRKASLGEYGEVEYSVGGVPVIERDSLASYDARQAAWERKRTQREKDKRASLEANRHEATLAAVVHERLPSIREAFETITGTYHGTVEVVAGDRLSIRVADVPSLYVNPGMAWRRHVQVLAAAERYVVQQLKAGKPLADVQVSATGWPVDD
jgi:hypothetical protein